MSATGSPTTRPESPPEPTAQAALRRRSLLRDLAGLKESLPELVLSSLLLNLLGLALPLGLLQTYDRILPNTSLYTLTALVTGMLLCLLLETVLRVARTTITGWISARFEYRTSVLAFRRLLGLPIEVFDRRGTGAHLENMASISLLRDFHSGQMLLAVIDIPFAAVYLGLIAFFASWLVFVPLALMTAYGLAGVILGRRSAAAMERRIQLDGSRGNFLVETLAGIHGIKVMAMEALMMRRHERLLETAVDADLSVAHHAALASTLAQAFSYLTIVLVVGLGSILVVQGAMTPGVLAACSLLAGRCILPVQATIERWNRYQATEPAQQRIGELLADGGPATKAAAGRIVEIRGRIQLDQVGYRPKGGAQVIKKISLEIAPGELIGIQGENGSGKSMLLALLCGRLQPTEGRILLDGHDLAELDPRELRRRVVYVPQQPELFHGTILDNLTLFRPELTAEAKEVARTLGIDRVVANLPQGYLSQVGEAAQDGLPRGIRQLIVIARALVQRPRVLLFDEANTAIDEAGDLALKAAFEKLKGSCTIVLVTPRPSLLDVAQRVFRLAGGTLLDRGAVLLHLQPVVRAPPAAVRPDAGPAPPAVPDPPAEEEGGAIHVDFLRPIRDGSAFGQCLLPLLRALSWNQDLRHLAESLPHFKTVLDLVDFRNVMANLRFASSEMPTSLDALDPRLLPCLFVGDGDRPFVLIAHGEDGILAFDGRSGVETRLPCAGMRGIACFFRPSATEAGQARGPRSWFRGVLGRFHRLVLAVLGLSLLVNLLSLGTPLFTMSVYDKVIATGNLDMLPAFILGVLIVIAGDEALRDIRQKICAFIGARISYIVGTEVFNRTLLLPVGLTERASIASQLSRFKDLDGFREMFGGVALAALVDMPFIVVYLALLTLLGGWVVTVPLAALALFAILVAAVLPVVRQRLAVSGRTADRRQEFVVETLTKMRAIHSAAIEDTWQKRFEQYAADAGMANYRSGQLHNLLAGAAQALLVMGGVGTMAVGAVEVIGGTMTAGALIASMMLVWRALTPIQAGFAIITRASQALASIRQVDMLMGFKVERDMGAPGDGALQLAGAVSFSRVSLRYTAETDPALVGVSFELQPGEVMAVVGPDGAGKSTLLKLAAGLYAPQAGNVRIDGADIRQIDPLELRQLIAFVPAAPDLFHGTIAQNLRLAHPTASDAELRAAAEQAGGLKEIESLPDGFDTWVGDSRTNRLPASLPQKLSLARAYLKDSRLLLMDEPVNGLDFEADALFREFLAKSRGKRSILIVTHRPSHLDLADKILVLDRGTVQLSGPASEVRQKLTRGAV